MHEFILSLKANQMNKVRAGQPINEENNRPDQTPPKPKIHHLPHTYPDAG